MDDSWSSCYEHCCSDADNISDWCVSRFKAGIFSLFLCKTQYKCVSCFQFLHKLRNKLKNIPLPPGELGHVIKLQGAAGMWGGAGGCIQQSPLPYSNIHQYIVNHWAPSEIAIRKFYWIMFFQNTYSSMSGDYFGFNLKWQKWRLLYWGNFRS